MREGARARPLWGECDSGYRGQLSAAGRAKLAPVRVGLNANSINAPDGVTPADIEFHSAFGAWGTRIPVEWQRIERRPGIYDWEQLDGTITRSVQRGVEPWALVSGAPEHACQPGTRTLGPGGSCPPQANLYQAFLQDLASRYRGKLTFYEIWNEPDFDYFWTGKATPEEYADFLVGAHRALKAAEPRAQVVMASTAGTNLPYLGRILSHLRGAKVFDAISIHPYRSSPRTGFITVGPEEFRPVADENGREHSVDFLGEMRLHRALLDVRGYVGVPMWITEYGWGAHDEVGGKAFVTLSQQAGYLKHTYEILSAHADLLVPGLFWFTDADWAADPSNQKAQWQYGFFGLTRHNRHLKPAGCAFLQLARLQQR